MVSPDQPEVLRKLGQTGISDKAAEHHPHFEAARGFFAEVPSFPLHPASHSPRQTRREYFERVDRHMRATQVVDSEVDVVSTEFDGRRISLENYTAILLLLDVSAIIGFGVFFEWLFGGFESRLDYLADRQIAASIFAAGFYLLLSYAFALYSTRGILDRLFATRRFVICFIATFTTLVVIAVATKTAETYSRLWFFSWAITACMAVSLIRWFVVGQLRRALNRGGCVYTALSVGVFHDPLCAEEIAQYSAYEARTLKSLRLRDLSDLATISDHIARDEIDIVYIATNWEDAPIVLRNLHLLRHISAQIFVLPYCDGLRSSMLNVTLFGQSLSIRAVEKPIDGWNLWLKRMEDILIASAIILASLPIMLLIALAIRIESPGPVFFRQRRTGFNGRVFELWKFRSMYGDMTDHHATIQTRKQDPRVTRVGRFIRRTSLDELPQFFNVLQGEMSVVGPRPHALQTRTHGQSLEELVDYYAVRHRMKPGLTGWAQVHGLRGELDSVDKLRRRVDYDIEYIDRWSIWLDFKIICRTALLVVRDPHAY